MTNPTIINIPLIDYNLYIYYDKKGFELFLNKVKQTNPDWDFNDQMLGYCFENNIWIKDLKDNETIFHELQHYFDWLFEHLSCEKETEFKAYLSSYVLCNILKVVE